MYRQTSKLAGLFVAMSNAGKIGFSPLRSFSGLSRPSIASPLDVFGHRESKVICQGLTEENAAFQTRQLRRTGYGTKVVAGVSPRRTKHLGIDVFDSVAEAKAETKANASVIYVPTPVAADAIIEAVEAELDLVVCVSEVLPSQMAKVKAALLGQSKTRLVGPNCSGIIRPGVFKVGVMPGYEHKKGYIGIVSAADLWTYEQTVFSTSRAGLGQSACVGIGRDHFHGTTFADCIRVFLDDPQTKGIVLLGAIPGTEEEDLVALIKESRTEKPIVAFLDDLATKLGPRITTECGGPRILLDRGVNNTGTTKSLIAAGVTMVGHPAFIGEKLLEGFSQQGRLVGEELDGKRIKRILTPCMELYGTTPTKGHYIGQCDGSFKQDPITKVVEFSCNGLFIKDDKGRFVAGTFRDSSTTSSTEAEADGIKELSLLAIKKECFPLTIETDCKSVVTDISKDILNHSSSTYMQARELIRSKKITLKQKFREILKIPDLLARLRQSMNSKVFNSIDEIPDDFTRHWVEGLLEHDRLGLAHRRLIPVKEK